MVAVSQIIGFLSQIEAEIFGCGAVKSLLFDAYWLAYAYVHLFSCLAPYFSWQTQRSRRPAYMSEYVEPPAV